MKKIGILASGSGTNAENIIRYFESSPVARVKVVLSNNSGAYVLQRAHNLHVEAHDFTRDEFYNDTLVADMLEGADVEYIVLAGFLWLVPPYFVERFRGRIINIHPALLPKYGGKGMYGDNVHRAVVAAGETESGITIHKVNENYDEGDILAQFRVALAPTDTPEDVAGKVHALEYEHFPAVIEQHIKEIWRLE